MKWGWFVLLVVGCNHESSKMFVTSASYVGPFVTATSDHLQYADDACNQLAQAAGLAGHYKAWLSSSSVDAISRIADVGPWYRMDGVKLFQNRAALSAAPLAAISLTEKNTAAAATVWTGTKNGGLKGIDAHLELCSDWADSGAAIVGSTSASDATWTELQSQNCSHEQGSASLYCLEQ